MPGDMLFLIKLKVKMKNSSRKILSADSRSAVGNVSVTCRPTVDRRVTNSRKWELFTITKLSNDLRERAEILENKIQASIECELLLSDTMNKGGKFLKKLWCCVGGRV